MLNDDAKVNWRDIVSRSLKLRKDLLFTFLQNSRS